MYCEMCVSDSAAGKSKNFHVTIKLLGSWAMFYVLCFEALIFSEH